MKVAAVALALVLATTTWAQSGVPSKGQIPEKELGNSLQAMPPTLPSALICDRHF